jgi:glycosyltransferase involved in cell wall biosynthesis
MSRKAFGQPPLFSVIVPTHRRPGPLTALLGAIARQVFSPGLFEVIVVVDGGGKRPSGCAGAPALRVLGLPDRRGPAAARNAGVAAARGEYLAFTDDDCLPDPEWLARLAAAQEAFPGALCGGRTVNADPGNRCAEATALLYDYLYERYNPARVFGAFFTANNLALPRQAFVALGGFDETMRYGEDRDLCRRWALARRPFRFVPEAVVRHRHPLTAAAFLSLHARYGGGTFQYWRRSLRDGGSRARLSGPGWYAALVWHGVRRRGLRDGLPLSLLLGASQAATFWGLAREAWRTPVRGVISGDARAARGRRGRGGTGLLHHSAAGREAVVSETLDFRSADLPARAEKDGAPPESSGVEASPGGV